MAGLYLKPSMRSFAEALLTLSASYTRSDWVPFACCNFCASAGSFVACRKSPVHCACYARQACSGFESAQSSVLS